MSKHQKPLLNQIIPPGARRPVIQSPPKSKCWTFTFRFWKQIEYFGLDKSDNKWFVSLLEKLADLSKMDIDDFRSDGGMKDYWRYHKIDWEARKIPISKSDLNWVSREYLENDQDYEFVQFQITKGLGRVIGFWDENLVFNIVLLDPLHNLQPAKSYDYKVEGCSPLGTDMASLIKDIEHAKSRTCKQPACPVNHELSCLPKGNYDEYITILRANKDLHLKAASVIKDQQVTWECILEYGIQAITETAEIKPAADS